MGTQNLHELIGYVQSTLPYEPRQDVLWRHAIASRQLGQFVGVAITHHPQLTPDARPMTGLEDAGSDVLVQTLYLLTSAGLDIEKLAILALNRMKDRVWEKTPPNRIGGKPAGTLAHPWPGALNGTLLTGRLLYRIPKTPVDRPYILILDHLDNDEVADLRRMKDAGNLLGVITIHGGMLSHAANVCREWQIPCIVGVGSLPPGTAVSVQADMLGQRAVVDIA